jgi:PAS domain-containing protein
MLAEEINIYKLFKIHPTAMALLTTDLEFIDANDEFLAVTGYPLEQLIGRNAFGVLPKMPPDQGGQPKWTCLEEAQTSGKHECLSLTRYDIQDPAIPGLFHERYWSSAVMPIRAVDGHVEALEFSARDVTSIIMEFKKLQDQEGQTQRQRPLVPSPSPPADDNLVLVYSEV